MSRTSLSDGVVYAARNGDKSAMNDIVAELAPIVEIAASANVGRCPLTRSDLIQEGMIGLLGAVYGYSADGGASFRTYAATCITNSIRNAVRKQSAKKSMPLNAYVSLDQLDEATDFSTDPQTLMSMQFGMSELNQLIETELTRLERDTLKLHIAGYCNRDVAEMLSVTEKSVDNALQRARKKLREKWIP